MSATVNANGSATNDLLADIQEATPIQRSKATRKPRATTAIDATVVESCKNIFAKGSAIVPHRAFATAKDASKATNLLFRHTKIAAEQIVVNDKPRAAKRSIYQFTDEFRAANAWSANATNDQFFVEFSLTFTKTRKPKETATA